MDSLRGARSISIALIWVAACASGGREQAQGTRFAVVSAAVARDLRTGLEWTRHDNGTGLDFDRAQAYCRSLSVDAAGRWRLPTVDELAPLYDGTAGRIPCGDATCAIDPIFTLTNPYLWTATSRSPGTRVYVDFQFGTRLAPTVTPRLVRRVLCVRAVPVDNDAGSPPG